MYSSATGVLKVLFLSLLENVSSFFPPFSSVPMKN
jgi:hypothetical protein